MSVWKGQTVAPQLWLVVLNWRPLIVDVRVIRWAFVFNFSRKASR